MISINWDEVREGVVTVSKYIPGGNLGMTNSVLNLPSALIMLLVMVIIEEVPIVIDWMESELVNPDPVSVSMSPGKTFELDIFIRDEGM